MNKKPMLQQKKWRVYFAPFYAKVVETNSFVIEADKFSIKEDFTVFEIEEEGVIFSIRSKNLEIILPIKEISENDIIFKDIDFSLFSSIKMESNNIKIDSAKEKIMALLTKNPDPKRRYTIKELNRLIWNIGEKNIRLACSELVLENRISFEIGNGKQHNTKFYFLSDNKLDNKDKQKSIDNIENADRTEDDSE